jgi:hypothetical protein
MDPFSIGALYLAAGLAVIAVGGALLVAPGRSSRALNDWFAVVPAVARGQWPKALVFRGVGVGLIVYGAVLAGRAISFLASAA